MMSMIYSDFLDVNELKLLSQSMNSRAKQAGRSGKVNVDSLRDRIYQSGGQCEWCGVSLVNKAFEVDHIVAFDRGGSNTADNIAIACPTCNRRKSSKHAAQFAQESYARTGIMTDLLKRVLGHFEVDAARQQQSFFDDDSPSPQIEHDDDLGDDPPPYRWA